jgi:hypothetical protein
MFAKENKLVPETFDPAGRGGKDQKNPVKFTKLSEVTDILKARARAHRGRSIWIMFKSYSAENKEFDMLN